MEHEGIPHPEEDFDSEDIEDIKAIKVIEAIEAHYEAIRAQYEEELETMRKEKTDLAVKIVRLEGEKKVLILRLENERKEQQVRYELLEKIILAYSSEDAKSVYYKIISKDGAGTSSGTWRSG